MRGSVTHQGWKHEGLASDWCLCSFELALRGRVPPHTQRAFSQVMITPSSIRRHAHTRRLRCCARAYRRVQHILPHKNGFSRSVCAIVLSYAKRQFTSACACWKELMCQQSFCLSTMELHYFVSSQQSLKLNLQKTLACFTNQQIYNAFSMYCTDVALPVCLGLNNRRRLKGFCFHFCCIRLEDNALGLHVEYTVIPAKVASQ